MATENVPLVATENVPLRRSALLSVLFFALLIGGPAMANDKSCTRVEVEPEWAESGVRIKRAQGGTSTTPPKPASQRTPIEKNAVVDPQLTRRQVQALAATVKLHGYRCDSIHTARRAFFTARAAFRVRCNESQYEYRIHGTGDGRVQVILDGSYARRARESSR